MKSEETLKKEFLSKIDILKDFVCKNIDKKTIKNFECFEDLADYHQMLLEYIPKVFTSEDLLFFNSQEINTKDALEGRNFKFNVMYKMYKGEPYASILSAIIVYYLSTLKFGFGTYFYYQDGKPIIKDVSFDVSANGDYESAHKRYLKTKETSLSKWSPEGYILIRGEDIPAIITEDGRCFFAINVHSGLETWLRINGLNIDNAVRVRIFYKQNGKIMLSGCYGKQKATEVIKAKKNDVVILTEEQTKTIVQIYDVCFMNNKHFPSLNKILTDGGNTDGLGFERQIYSKTSKLGKKINVTKHNKLMFDTFGRNYIDSSEFTKDLNGIIQNYPEITFE